MAAAMDDKRSAKRVIHYETIKINRAGCAFAIADKPRVYPKEDRGNGNG